MGVSHKIRVTLQNRSSLASKSGVFGLLSLDPFCGLHINPMASDSAPEFPTYPSIGRIYSGDTDESPFTSNLVTPTDEFSNPQPGIHERLDAAKSLLGYFASRGSPEDANKIQEILPSKTDAKKENLSPVLDESLKMNKVESESEGLLQVNQEEEPKHGLPNTFDSAETFVTSSSTHSILRRRGTSFYNLPNNHIVVQGSSLESDAKSEAHPGDNDGQLMGDPIIESGIGAELWATDIGPLIRSLTVRAPFVLAFRVICFLPWCIAVGGALILAPENLESVAFRSGYLPSVSGIRRYSHWAQYGYHHIVAFLTALGAITWMFPTIGVMGMGALLAQFCIAWHSFLFDRNIPLGEDDRQTVYILMTTTWFNDSNIGIKKVGDAYYPVPIEPSLETAGGEDLGVSDDEGTG
ncbi:hypothetical protein M413DRAFT_26253 [Hebeloma cylindrosporum]|uniref:Uncharacterized protein n=1 Tax=Hebeloma cylindrosporum TaxID=76867 RepID=A0A0C3CFV0_HEBCY|nr:hypothetical protein M413DRAFT_26253 [Hebeloma cylindrosporum h7]